MHWCVKEFDKDLFVPTKYISTGTVTLNLDYMTIWIIWPKKLTSRLDRTNQITGFSS